MDLLLRERIEKGKNAGEGLGRGKVLSLKRCLLAQELGSRERKLGPGVEDFSGLEARYS